MYRLFARPMLRFQDSEKAHSRTIFMLKVMSSNFLTRKLLSLLYLSRKKLPVNVFGLDFKHPFGLAAGMDKRAEALLGWESIGLSFTEIGGVTMFEQEGNSKPRMFRSDSKKALINRMGFNNPGSERIREKLSKHYSKRSKPKIPLWINLGKSKLTENKDAHVDYSTTMKRLWEFGDVFVINVSSPNTPNLRDLQNQDDLKRIIDSCMDVNKREAKNVDNVMKPVLIKIAPDMVKEQLESIVKTALDSGCSGIIATNTTISRPTNLTSKEASIFSETGGMSGKPLQELSTDFISMVYGMTEGKIPIVGVGGIMNAEDAWEKIISGASLLQAYSGFVFEGPSLSKSIVNGLSKKLKENGLSTIQEAVGLKHRNGG